MGLQTKLLHYRGTDRRAGNYSCQGVGRIGTSKGEGSRWDRGPGGGEVGSGWERGGQEGGRPLVTSRRWPRNADSFGLGASFGENEKNEKNEKK